LAGGMFELVGALEDLDQVKNNVAANLGINSELSAVTVAILGSDAIFAADFGLPGENLFVIADAGHPLGDAAAGWAGLTAGIPVVGAASGAMVAAMTLSTIPAVPDVADITGDVVGSAFTKFGGFEPFSGEGIFAVGANDPAADITNEDASDAVQVAGGNHFDFVAIVAGLSQFGTGSPFLPVAGALGVGLLVGGMAFAGARRLRRK